tara:strand:+ start:374 stop:511 length:138 start_codon:yes stop_codon:yes gene_type:complete
MEEELKKLLIKELNNLSRNVPWDGMYDNLIKKIIQLFSKEKDGNI